MKNARINGFRQVLLVSRRAVVQGALGIVASAVMSTSYAVINEEPIPGYLASFANRRQIDGLKLWKDGSTMVATTLEAYNFEQWARANTSPLWREHQGTRNICVLRQAQSAMYSLGFPPISEEDYVRQVGKLEDVSMPDALKAVGIPALDYKSGYFQSFKGDSDSFRQSLLVLPLEKMSISQLIEYGVNMGHIVIVALDYKTLHQGYLKKINYPEDAPASKKLASLDNGSHAVRVISLTKSDRFTISEVTLYDSASPDANNMRYSISYDTFMRAYNNSSNKNKFHRGVYVTRERVFPPLIEMY